jgi:hypothetical protein
MTMWSPDELDGVGGAVGATFVDVTGPDAHPHTIRLVRSQP